MAGSIGLLRYLRRGKAPGPDGILNEMIVYRGFRLIESLTQLLNIAIDEECVPSGWRKSYVVPLFKSGDTEVASKTIEESHLGVVLQRYSLGA